MQKTILQFNLEKIWKIYQGNSYDKTGNLLTDGTLTNTWNYKNQLNQTTKGTTTINYYYDYQGNRVWYKVGTTNTYYPNKYYNTDTTKKTKSIYAGDQLVATIETVGAVVTPYYNHADQVNSITAVSSSAGALTQNLDYYPYGSTRISSGSYTSGKQFLSQVKDQNTNLSYLNARYYEESKGRFISQDPVFWELGQSENGKKALLNPQTLNSYSYAGNNPITYSDPDGKFVPALIAAAGALAMYAPQITSFLQSLTTPLGQVAISQVGQDVQKGNYGMAVVGALTAGELPIPKVPKGLSLGQDFGKLGKVAETIPGELKSFTNIVTKDPYHGLDQAITRGISPQLIKDTVKNPLVKLQQGSNSVYLTNKAGVVLDKLGGLITTYGKSDFKSHITNILNKIK